MSRFPEDHPLEYVRGAKRPSVPNMLKTLARRAAWLTERVDKLSAKYGFEDVRNCQEMRELEAVARVVEILEPRAETCPSCGRGGTDKPWTKKQGNEKET